MANSHFQPPPISSKQPFWKRRWVVLVATVLLTAVVGSFTNEIVSRLLDSGGDQSKPTVTQNDAVAAQQEKDRQTKVALEAKKLSAIPPYPADAVEFQGHRYKVFQEQLSWPGAKARCIGMGGHLPIVTSKRENDFLTQLALKTLRTHEKFDGIWLGATDEVQEGEWVCVNGIQMTYHNWLGNQPNNKQQAEHYLLLWLAENGWVDQPNVSTLHRTFFACEWDSISTVKSGPNVPPDGFTSLFNGKTIDGWRGDPQFWKVIDGAIVGESPAGFGGYLVSRLQYKNFVLKLKFKLHRGNSGINFRSQPNPQRPNGMIGSQAEICHVRGLPLLKGKDLVTGAIAAEGNGRGVIADMSELLKPSILASTRKVDWSDYVITALGDRIAIEVNGYTTIDFRDAKGEKEGHFGLQLHGTGTKISFKDIFIKALPE